MAFENTRSAGFGAVQRVRTLDQEGDDRGTLRGAADLLDDHRGEALGRLVHHQQIRRLPVVDADGRLLGEAYQEVPLRSPRPSPPPCSSG